MRFVEKADLDGAPRWLLGRFSVTCPADVSLVDAALAEARRAPRRGNESWYAEVTYEPSGGTVTVDL